MNRRNSSTQHLISANKTNQTMPNPDEIWDIPVRQTEWDETDHDKYETLRERLDIDYIRVIGPPNTVLPELTSVSFSIGRSLTKISKEPWFSLLCTAPYYVFVPLAFKEVIANSIQDQIFRVPLKTTENPERVFNISPKRISKFDLLKVS